MSFGDSGSSQQGRVGWSSAGLVLAVFLAVGVFPDAVEGIKSRFGLSDTPERVGEVAAYVPVWALANLDYPFWGVGTGMQQNARGIFGVTSEWVSEGDVGRYLIEIGAVGYVLFWIARLGLAVALWRLSLRLRRYSIGVSGVALSLAAYSLIANITFDHVSQSLFFFLCGAVLLHARACLAGDGSGEMRRRWSL